MRAHRTRLPARQVRGLPPREARGVQLHTPRPLPELWRPTHGRDRRTSRRPRPARATGPPVESVVPLPASSPLCHATRGPHPNPWHHLPGDLHLPHPPRRIARGRRRSHRSRHPRPTLPPQTPRSGTTQRARAASGTVGPRRTRRLGLAHRFPTPLTERGPSPPRASLTEPRPPSSAHPHFPHSSTNPPNGGSEIPAPDPSNRLEPNTAILCRLPGSMGYFPYSRGEGAVVPVAARRTRIRARPPPAFGGLKARPGEKCGLALSRDICQAHPDGRVMTARPNSASARPDRSRSVLIR